MSNVSAGGGKRTDAMAEWLSGFAASKRRLVVTALVAALVYLAGVTPRWWPTTDSAVYISLARSMAAGDGYRVNGEAHTTFPPGLPVILAGLEKAFGRTFWAPNLFIALAGMVAVVAIFATMREIADNGGIALAVGLCTAFSCSFYVYAHRILSDVPFVAAFWLMLYACVRFMRGGNWWLAPAGVFAAAGVALRLPGLLVLMPAAGAMAFDSAMLARRGRETDVERAARRPARFSGRGAAVGLAVLVPSATVAGLFYLFVSAGGAEPGYVGLVGPRVSQDLWQQAARLGRGFAAMPAAVAEMLTRQPDLWPIGLVAIASAGVGAVRLWARGWRVVPVALAAYPALLAACLGSYGMQTRYLLVIWPFFIYAALAGLLWATENSGEARGQRAAGGAQAWIVAGFTVAVIGFNAPRIVWEGPYCGALSYTQRYYETVRGGGYKDLFKIADILKDRAPSEERIAAVTDADIVLHVASERAVTRVTEAAGGKDADAGRAMDFLGAHKELRFVVVGTTERRKELIDGVREALEKDALWTAVHSGRYALYERKG